jgi:hypothetical protein
LADLQRAVFREQGCGLVPLSEIDGGGVAVEKIGNVGLIRQERGPPRELADAGGQRFGRSDLVHAFARATQGGVRDGPGDRGGGVVSRQLRRGFTPTGVGVSGRGQGLRAEIADHPAAVLENVLVLVDTAVPGGRAAESAEHGENAPASPGGAAVGAEVDHRLEQNVRVDAAFGKAEPTLTDLLQEQLANGFPALGTLLVVGHGVFGEQIGKVVPETEFDVVAVGILETLDCPDGFDGFDARFEADYFELESLERVRLLSWRQSRRACDGERQENGAETAFHWTRKRRTRPATVPAARPARSPPTRPVRADAPSNPKCVYPDSRRFSPTPRFRHSPQNRACPYIRPGQARPPHRQDA